MPDSTEATLAHIRGVQALMGCAVQELTLRAGCHDHSKLLPPEKECFDEITVRLRETPYGSEGYRATLREFQPAIDHHQFSNDHHPEFFERGVHGMDCFQLIEMACDWIAASRRHADGDVLASIWISAERYGMTEREVELVTKTIERLLKLEAQHA